MKCMKRDFKIERFSENQVESKLKDGWIFCSKKEWKDETRVKEEPKKEKVVKESKNNKKK